VVIAEAILDYQSYSGSRAGTMVMGKAQNSLPNEEPHKSIALIIVFLAGSLKDQLVIWSRLSSNRRDSKCCSRRHGLSVSLHQLIILSIVSPIRVVFIQ
jgi:hypothetical protein